MALKVDALQNPYFEAWYDHHIQSFIMIPLILYGQMKAVKLSPLDTETAPHETHWMLEVLHYHKQLRLIEEGSGSWSEFLYAAPTWEFLWMWKACRYFVVTLRLHIVKALNVFRHQWSPTHKTIKFWPFGVANCEKSISVFSFFHQMRSRIFKWFAKVNRCWS